VEINGNRCSPAAIGPIRWVSASYIGSESNALWSDSYLVNPAVFIPGNCTAGAIWFSLLPGPLLSRQVTPTRRSGELFALAGAPGNPYYTRMCGTHWTPAGRASYNGLVLAITKRPEQWSAHQRQPYLVALHQRTWSNGGKQAPGNAGAGRPSKAQMTGDTIEANCQANEFGGTFAFRSLAHFLWLPWCMKYPSAPISTLRVFASGLEVRRDFPRRIGLPAFAGRAVERRIADTPASACRASSGRYQVLQGPRWCPNPGPASELLD
jgi:hypothetical protein